jgi:hypothetical protein
MMIDYKQGTGQKQRLTIDYDATREAVAQARGERVGALGANCLARRVAEQPPLLAWAVWAIEAYEHSMAVVTFGAKDAESKVVGNAESNLLGAFDLHRWASGV